MDISNKLYELRKQKNLSQEEVANILNVTRQTVSKWETGQSTPDFDKVLPICELYNISTQELFGVESGYKDELSLNSESELKDDEQTIKNRKIKALGICIAVFLYIISVAWPMLAIGVFKISGVVSTAVMIAIIAIATALIIYVSITCSDKNKTDKADANNEDKGIRNTITGIVSLLILVLYFIISFATKAWYITWVLFIIMALVNEIIKLIFRLRSDKNEK